MDEQGPESERAMAEYLRNHLFRDFEWTASSLKSSDSIATLRIGNPDETVEYLISITRTRVQG